MHDCERCAQQPGRYCRECEIERQAEHFYKVHLVARMHARKLDDVAHLSFAMLSDVDQIGWRAVANAHRDMAR